MQFPSDGIVIAGKGGRVGETGAQHAPGTVNPSGIGHCADAVECVQSAAETNAAAASKRDRIMGVLE